MTRQEFINWLGSKGLKGIYSGKDKLMVVSGEDVHNKLRHSFEVLKMDFRVVIEGEKVIKKLPTFRLSLIKGKLAAIKKY